MSWLGTPNGRDEESSYGNKAAGEMHRKASVSHKLPQGRDTANKTAMAHASGSPERERLTEAVRFRDAPAPMTGTEFEIAWRELVASAGKAADNVGCMACSQCERCTDCTFCAMGRGLARCHYCERCSDCIDCTHCLGSAGCVACQHCIECERCASSAYLVRSIGCSRCNYCFGCVGLSRRDFCILNEQYDRARYFELVARIARDLHLVVR
jgi:hypothetical protein